ncbi:hypothetical protein BGZ60DRAFT_535876 [Tricladium varicosporioides]|nr:hypothetical protein BGZ60DRAFT_535876 [Hymenoscyphus varicosporioides]
MNRDQTKAAHYIQQLDEARCQGNWDVVPELVRKLKKHAPNRTCLTLTAESEHAVSQLGPNPINSATHPETARPSTANSAHSNTITRYIPLLLEAIEKERGFVEDEFQASVCLGWIHWQLGEPALAASRLPKSIEEEFSQLDGTSKESAKWTRVCALKASYMKGTSQIRTGAVAEALETFESALPILSTVAPTTRSDKELWNWTELYLTGFCMLSSHAIKSKISSILETETLSAFRAWGKFWESQAPAPAGGRAPSADVPRRRVWREYYITLSDLLQQELPFPTTALTTAYAETSTRLQQRAELKRVEAKYETLLLSEVEFPKAQEASEEVEAFVEISIQNWRILCGSSWKEHDLGEGGSEAVSRGLLDILYRAATKTFHSTAILRHLFTVHLAIAEFDLAIKAFDTYLEIVKKGKARVEKTGILEHGLDEDETVLKTVSGCIRALCRYGSRPGAEKAKELGHYLEDWLEKHHPEISADGNGRVLGNGDRNSKHAKAVTTPRIFALAWRSIGIAYAQWARLTYDAPTRSDTQLQAVKCFRKALLPEYEDPTDVETLFALAILLAERRQLGPAIEAVKTGLMRKQSSNSRIPHTVGPYPGRFARERSLIPLWHLMALLLSARQEFVTAARSCEGAFEQFQDPKNLFGEDDLNNGYRSEHLTEKATPKISGVVDEMDDFEKESVLEVKMTQLALIEVLEGPEIAVNASDELLSLYTRLFGDPLKITVPTALPGTAMPPKSSAGTIRSIKGSLFGRTGRSTRKMNTLGSGITEETDAPRPQTTASTIAPTIQVTSEKVSGTKTRSNSMKEPHHHEKLQKRSGSVSRKKSTSTRDRSSSTNGRIRKAGTRDSSPKHIATAEDGDNFFTPPLDTDSQEDWFSGPSGHVGLAVSQESSAKTSRPNTLSKPMPPKTQKLPQKEQALKIAHHDSIIAQGTRFPRVSPFLSTTTPVTRFPKEQERRRRTTILIKVWLLIGGFYRRASMFDDAKGATEEAQNLVRALESDILKDPSSNVSMNNSEWSGDKSVGELWGDVFSERGSLALAECSPYIALENFESALTNCPDHPSATVGLSNILLDIYSKDLLPPPSIPPLVQPHSLHTPFASAIVNLIRSTNPSYPLPSTTIQPSSLFTCPRGPLGLPTAKPVSSFASIHAEASTPTTDASSQQPTPSETPTALLDRLAARDRAYGLLSSLTKLGTGWNYSEAWFALSRAYEDGGQPNKAREVLWWCVELEEARGVRDWNSMGSGGYVL